MIENEMNATVRCSEWCDECCGLHLAERIALKKQHQNTEKRKEKEMKSRLTSLQYKAYLKGWWIDRVTMREYVRTNKNKSLLFLFTFLFLTFLIIYQKILWVKIMTQPNYWLLWLDGRGEKVLRSLVFLALYWDGNQTSPLAFIFHSYHHSFVVMWCDVVVLWCCGDALLCDFGFIVGCNFNKSWNPIRIKTLM